MLNKKENFETKYDFNRDTLWPYLKTLILLLFVGAVICFVPGNFSPFWSIIPFGFAFVMIVIIIFACKNPEKFNYKGRRIDDLDFDDDEDS